jgi:hypothetical protein
MWDIKKHARALKLQAVSVRNAQAAMAHPVERSI